MVERVEGVAGEGGGEQPASPTVHQTDPGLPVTTDRELRGGSPGKTQRHIMTEA